MTNKFENLIKEIIKNGITAHSFDYSDSNGFTFSFSGFSKSGEATLFETNGSIICKTRYSQHDVIDNFDDFVRIAYLWYKDYSHSEPFSTPDPSFLPHFIKGGYVKEIKTYQPSK